MRMRFEAGGRGVARALVLAIVFLAGDPAFAQSSAYVTVFGAGVPAPTPSSRPADEEREQAEAEKPAVQTNLLPRVKLPPGAVPRPTEAPDFAAQAALDRIKSPPPGTRLSYVHLPSPRLNRSLGPSVVQKALSGTRLGGGYDSPSPEAITYDPRDLLEFRRSQLSDPRQP